MNRLKMYEPKPDNTVEKLTKELEEKEQAGTITDAEKGRLKAFREFPNNPRGAELVEKEHLGAISREEKAELSELRGGNSAENN